MVHKILHRYATHYEKIVEIRPDLYELAKKSKEGRGSTYNIKGTTVNYIMCGLENQAVMTAFDYLREQGIKVGSLVFDRLMIYKYKVSPTRLGEILVGSVSYTHLTLPTKRIV